MSEQTELEPQALQRMPSSPPMVAGVNIEALLEKAVDAKSAVDVLERLAVMRREMKAEAAKEAFDSAMAQFQAECPVIGKDSGVNDKSGKTRYRYASIQAIVGQTKALIQEHGFSYRVTAKVEEKFVTAICKVVHSLGHSEESEFKVPIDPDSYMNAAQKFASALTFAKRYAFCNAFGILTGDSDDDAAATDPYNAAGQNRRPAAPAPPIQHPRNQAPKPAAKRVPTAKTREWAFGKLVANGGEALRLVEFLQQAGAMMPNQKDLAEWPLQYVPSSEDELKALKKALTAFENGEPAKVPFYHGEAIEGEAPKEKPTTKSIEVPRDPDAGEQGDSEVADINPRWEKVTGTIAHVSVKHAPPPKKWVLYGIKIGEDWMNTFDTKLGALAESAKGREVDLYYSANDKGKTAEHIEV